MKVLTIASEITLTLYKQGAYPSHLLYGAIEIEKAGFQLVVKSGSSSNQFIRCIENVKIVLRERPNILFVPFISKDIYLIVILKLLGLFKKPIIGWSHRTVRSDSFLYKMFYRAYYKAFDKIFFLSPLNLKESVNGGILSADQVEHVVWGGDLKFYDNLIAEDESSYNQTFISTGKENRDFDILIKAFAANPKANIDIYSNYSNQNSDYSYLDTFKGTYPNIDIKMIKNDNSSFRFLAMQTANSFCVTIPLIQSSLSYCVGLSSVIDALALGKPLIVTNNPYHPIDVEKEGIGLKIDDNLEAWIDAINYLRDNPDIAKAMGDKAKLLAKEKYNIEFGSQTIIKYLTKIQSESN